jgi:hypothetical protein
VVRRHLGGQRREALVVAVREQPGLRRPARQARREAETGLAEDPPQRELVAPGQVGVPADAGVPQRVGDLGRDPDDPLQVVVPNGVVAQVDDGGGGVAQVDDAVTARLAPRRAGAPGVGRRRGGPARGRLGVRGRVRGGEPTRALVGRDGGAVGCRRARSRGVS